MLPSKWPSCTCMQNFKDFNEILSEISLFKKYMEKNDFSNSLPEKIGSNPFNFMFYTSLDAPENQLLYGVYYLYETVRVM